MNISIKSIYNTFLCCVLSVFISRSSYAQTKGVFSKKHGEVINSVYLNNRHLFINNAVNFDRVFKPLVIEKTIDTTIVTYEEEQCENDDCTDMSTEEIEYDGTLKGCNNEGYTNCTESNVKRHKTYYDRFRLEWGTQLKATVTFESNNTKNRLRGSFYFYVEDKGNVIYKSNLLDLTKHNTLIESINYQYLVKANYFSSKGESVINISKENQYVYSFYFYNTNIWGQKYNQTRYKVTVDIIKKEAYYLYKPLKRGGVVMESNEKGIDYSISNIDMSDAKEVNIIYNSGQSGNWRVGVCSTAEINKECKSPLGNAFGISSNTITLTRSDLKKLGSSLNIKEFYVYVTQENAFNRRWIKVEQEIYPGFDRITTNKVIEIKGTNHSKYKIANYTIQLNTKKPYNYTDGNLKLKNILKRKDNLFVSTTSDTKLITLKELQQNANQMTFSLNYTSQENTTYPYLRLDKFYLGASSNRFINPYIGGEYKEEVNTSKAQLDMSLIDYQQQEPIEVITFTPQLDFSRTEYKSTTAYTPYTNTIDIRLNDVTRYVARTSGPPPSKDLRGIDTIWTNRNFQQLRVNRSLSSDKYLSSGEQVAAFNTHYDTLKVTYDQRQIYSPLQLSSREITYQHLRESKQLLYAPIRIRWKRPEVVDRLTSVHTKGQMQITPNEGFNIPKNKGTYYVHIVYPDGNQWQVKSTQAGNTTFSPIDIAYRYHSDKPYVYYILTPASAIDLNRFRTHGVQYDFGDRISLLKPIEIHRARYTERGNPIDQPYGFHIDYDYSGTDPSLAHYARLDGGVFQEVTNQRIGNRELNTNLSFGIGLKHISGNPLHMHSMNTLTIDKTIIQVGRDTTIYGYKPLRITQVRVDSTQQYKGAEGKVHYHIEGGRKPYNIHLVKGSNTSYKTDVLNSNIPKGERVDVAKSFGQLEASESAYRHPSADVIQLFDYKIVVRDTFALFSGANPKSTTEQAFRILEPDTFRIDNYTKYQVGDIYPDVSQRIWVHEARGYHKTNGYMVLETEGGFEPYTYMLVRIMGPYKDTLVNGYWGTHRLNGIPLKDGRKLSISWKKGEEQMENYQDTDGSWKQRIQPTTLDTIKGLDSAKYRLVVKDRFGVAPQIDETVNISHPDTLKFDQILPIHACSTDDKGRFRVYTKGGRQWSQEKNNKQVSDMDYTYNVDQQISFRGIVDYPLNPYYFKAKDSVVISSVANQFVLTPHSQYKYKIQAADIYGNTAFEEHKIDVVPNPIKWKTIWVGNETTNDLQKNDGLVVPFVADGLGNVRYSLTKAFDKTTYRFTQDPKGELPDGFFGLERNTIGNYTLTAIDQYGLGCEIDTTFSVAEPTINMTVEENKHLRIYPLQKGASNGRINISAFNGWRKQKVDHLELIKPSGSIDHFLYRWYKKNIQTGVYELLPDQSTAQLDNIPAGYYRYRVVNPSDDLNRGHHYIDNELEILEPDTFQIQLAQPYFKWGNDTICHSCTDGAMDATIVGGWSSDRPVEGTARTPTYQFRVHYISPSGRIAEITHDIQRVTPKQNQEVLKLRNLTEGQYAIDAWYSYIFPDNSRKEVHALDTFRVVRATPIEITTADLIPVSRFGHNDGSLDMTVSGGIPPYRLSWKHLATTQPRLIKMPAGTYTLCVKDLIHEHLGANECAKTTTVTITQPAVLRPNLKLIEPLEFGKKGSIESIPTGGYSPYTIFFKDLNKEVLSTTFKHEAISGRYIVEVQDKAFVNSSGIRGARTIDTVFLDQPAVFETSIANHRPRVCAASPDGQLEAIPTGGAVANTHQYSYQWIHKTKGIWVNIPKATSKRLTHLSYGDYGVQVRDTNGIERIAYTAISEADTLKGTSSSVSTSRSCYSDGTLELSISGGTAPYRVVWQDGTPHTIKRERLKTGIYRYRVYDAIGCSISDSVIVRSQDGFWLQIDASQPKCASCFGSAKVQLAKSSSSDSFEWLDATGSKLSSTYAVSHLVTGKYTLRYTNNELRSSSCQFIERTVNIQQPDELQVDIRKNKTKLCHGATNGRLVAVPAGGVPPYTYAWYSSISPVVVDSDSILDNISAGDYTLVLTDKYNNQIRQSILMSQNNALVLDSVVRTKVDCHGNSTGSLAAYISGGQKPYTYKWSTGNTGSILANIAEGKYELTVTDENGCTLKTEHQMIQPAEALSATYILSAQSCFEGCDALVQLNPKGGTAPYQLLWNNTQTMTNNRTSTCEGQYTAAVQDSKGCKTEISVTVPKLPKPNLELGSPQYICQQQQIRLQPQFKNFKPTKYNWFRNEIPIGSESNLLINQAGTYRLQAESENTCRVWDTVVVTAVNEPFAADIVSSAQELTQREVSIVNLSYPNVQLSEWIGFESSDNYEIVEQTPLVTRLRFNTPGKYKFGLKHTNGKCQETDYTTIQILENTFINEKGEDTGIDKSLSMFDEMTMFPMPFNRELTLKMSSKKNMRASVNILSIVSGQSVYNRPVLMNDGQITIPLQEMTPGVYLLVISSENQVMSKTILKAN